MTEEVEFPAEKLEKIRKATAEFKETISSYFKDMNVEVKNWRFAIGKTEEGHTVDAEIKLIIKPKPKY